MQNNDTTCTSKKRCGHWRDCDPCSRIRQAKISDLAQAIEEKHGKLSLSVISPTENSGTEIRRIRAAILRKHIAAAGIWTIETGEQFNKLHINIICPETNFEGITGANIHTEKIKTTARAAAAYISKRSGAPTKNQYPGRLTGSWGQVGQFMTTKEASPIIKAAAINDLLTTTHTRQTTQYFNSPNSNRPPEPTLSKEQYHEIALKHLAALYAAANRTTAKHF